MAASPLLEQFRRSAVSERLAISLDGSVLDAADIARLSRESAAALLVRLASIQAAIAVEFLRQFTADSSDLGRTRPEFVEPGRPVKASSSGLAFCASTEGEKRGMDRDPTMDLESAAPERPYLSVKETGERFGVSRSMLYHWIESGKLNEAGGLRRLGGRRLVIDWKVLKEALERGEFEQECDSRDSRA